MRSTAKREGEGALVVLVVQVLAGLAPAVVVAAAVARVVLPAVARVVLLLAELVLLAVLALSAQAVPVRAVQGGSQDRLSPAGSCLHFFKKG